MFRNSLSIETTICGGQSLWTIIDVAVHTVQNQFIDTLNLVTVLRLHTKAFQIIYFGNQSNTKIHQTNGR